MFKSEDWIVKNKEKDSYGDIRVVETPRIGKIIFSVLSALIFLIVVFGSFGTVNPGERGVKVRLGEVTGVIEPGLYVKVPVIETVHKMDVKTRTIDYDKDGDEGDKKNTGANLFGASKDLQDVEIGVVVNYHIDANKVDFIYSQFKNVDTYESTIIEPIIRELVKSTSAEYTAEEMVTKRAEFGDKVNKLLNDRMSSKDAILERFSVTNFQFSEAFTESIEAKVTAVQNAEAARNKLEQIKFEAQQTIESAKAQAESIRIQAEAVTSQGGSDYVKLQWINAWKEGGAKVPTFISGSGSGENFLLDIGSIN